MANFPREIELDEDTENRLASYIEDELIRHYAERGDFVKNIGNWQEDYWAEPSNEIGTFPFKNSATLIIPLAAITLEAVHARTMTTMFALSQFVSAKAVSNKFTDHAQPVQKFLDDEFLRRIGIYKSINSSVLELEKFGTGVAKTGYDKIVKTAVREDKDGKEQEFEYVVKQGATIDSVPITRFLMPFVYQNPQESAWCGEEHSSTPYEVRLMESSGKMKKGTMDKLAAHFTSSPQPNGNSGEEFQKTQEELENRVTIWPERVNWVELWMGFDVDGTEKLVVDGTISQEFAQNGFDKEIVVYYHRESRTFLSIRYNWHEDLRRPYYYGNYFPVEHRWAGIGVCKQVEQFQIEITTQHRQRIDNATLANCRMLKVSNLSKYGPDEPIFPGKMWFVDNKDDIESFQLGEIYPSSYSNENSSLLYLQQRTGVNEVNLGMPQQGTPGTATSDLARIQEGNKKFDFTYRNTKTFVNDVVQSSILNIKQFGPRASVYYETVENGDKVKDFFSQDFQLIKEGMLLQIEVAGQQDNKLLDRNNWQQVAALLTQYYNEMLTLAQAKGDPQLVQTIVNNGMLAATETMKQILESFDIKNVDRIIVQQALTNGQSSSTPSSGANTRPANAGPSAGMVSGGNALPQLNGGGVPGNGAVQR